MADDQANANTPSRELAKRDRQRSAPVRKRIARKRVLTINDDSINDRLDMIIRLLQVICMDVSRIANPIRPSQDASVSGQDASV